MVLDVVLNPRAATDFMHNQNAITGMGLSGATVSFLIFFVKQIGSIF